MVNAGFTWNNNVPNAPNNPSVDQPNMLTNTQSDNSIWAVDHIGFNTANGGIHNVIRFNNQAGDPGAIAGFGQLYTKTLSGDQQLYYESGNGTVTLLSSLIQSLVGNGYATFPGGLIIQWGNNASANPGTVNFPISFPNACFVVVGCTNANDRSFSVTAFTTANFTQRVLNPAGVTSRWIAIGN